jgi:competence protein ComEA
MFEKFSRKIGFTETEIVVILFLSGLFIFGFVYVEFFKENNSGQTKFDYTEQDSLFELYSRSEFLNNGGEYTSEQKQQIKKEVLELQDSFVYTKKDVESLAEKSIDINSASLELLMRLPGIGEVTSEKIIELRNQKGQFRKLDELMEVKGIGEVKFNKIKKFLYIK